MARPVVRPSAGISLELCSSRSTRPHVIHLPLMDYGQPKSEVWLVPCVLAVGVLPAGIWRIKSTQRSHGRHNSQAWLFGSRVMRVRACARNMSRFAMTHVECCVVAWPREAVAPTSALTMVPCRQGGRRSALGSQPLAHRPRARQNLPEFCRHAKRRSLPLRLSVMRSRSRSRSLSRSTARYALDQA